MPDADYTVPMSGKMVVHWWVAEDQEGDPQAFMGFAKDPTNLELEADHDENIGVQVTFSSGLTPMTRDELATSTLFVTDECLGRCVRPRVANPLFRAMREMQSRHGGWDGTPEEGSGIVVEDVDEIDREEDGQ